MFEDITLRPVRLDKGHGLLTVRSGPPGAQLALLASHADHADRLRVQALGDTVGGYHRWLSPIAPGTDHKGPDRERPWLAVHTPHIGGVLHEYALRGDQLRRRALGGDFSTHRIGSRELSTAVWLGSRLLLPNQDGTRLRVLDAEQGFTELATITLPGRVAMLRAWPGMPGAAVLLDDGRALYAAAKP